MKRIFSVVLCLVMTVACFFSGNLVSYAAEFDLFEDSVDGETGGADGVYLCDLPLDVVYDYANKFADMMGYGDYVCDNLIKYCRDGEWVGYYAVYSNQSVGTSGFAVIDFSEELGHYVTEFAYGTDSLPVENEEVAVSADSDDLIIMDSVSEMPFSYDFVDTQGISTYGSVMSGTLVIPRDFVFNLLGDVIPQEIIESNFMDTYDPYKSLIKREYMFEVADDRYTCTIAAVLAMLHQEGIEVPGMDDAAIVEWLWKKCEIMPTWSCTLDNYPIFFEWFGFTDRRVEKPGNPSEYCIAGKDSGIKLFRALYGESTYEKDASLFFGVCGFNRMTSMRGYYDGYGITPERFMNSVNNNFPSIFAFSQSCIYGDGEIRTLGHAVNVVGYARTKYHYNEQHESVPGEAFYIAVADGWNNDTVRYMDVTNMKFASGAENENKYFAFLLKK